MTAAGNAGPHRSEPGYDVKKTEVAGMAQRGGVVSSHVRFAPRSTRQIDPGEADLLIGFEAAEAPRWLPYLCPTGVVMVNTLRIAPPVVSVGLYDYPIGELAAAGN
ncbi:MAG: 2-oxoacid:acceptor oxidoreductase family protein [Candidatus Competibacteraceae bacterium]